MGTAAVQEQHARPGRRRFPVPGPLQRRFYLLVLAALLPLALLAGALLLREGATYREQHAAAARHATRAMTLAIDAELDATIASLDTLAASPRLRSGDLAGFHQEMRELLARRPHWANLLLSNARAAQLANASIAWGAALPQQVDPDTVVEALQSGKPVVGDIGYSQVFGQYLLPVQALARGPDGQLLVLTASLRPERFLHILRGQALDAGQVVGVIDRNRRFVARSQQNNQLVGKHPAAGLLWLLDQAGPERASGRAFNLENQPVFCAFTRSDKTGWTVLLSTPSANVSRPLERAWAGLAGALAFSTLAGMFAARAVARGVTRPLLELETAAHALRESRLPPLPRTRLPEIRRAGHAILAAYLDRERRLQLERDARLAEQRARQQAEQSSRAKDEFLAMLGHELRNPLAAISAASQILDYCGQERDHLAASADARDIIRQQSQHLGRLTEDLLDAGRVILGKVRLDCQPADVAAILNRSLAALRQAGRLNELTLTVQSQPAWAMVDSTRIGQILDNLIGNAVKYSPPPASIHISVARDGAEAVVRVTDNGLGMEPELQRRVFDLFVQGERSLGRSQGGMGIGLRVVKQLAELHGGSISARSDGPGKGSCFELRLPAMEPLAPLESRAALLETAAPLRVVVVEDNPDLRSSLAQLFSLKGHQVLEAADGEQGLEVILASQPDCAVVDIGLPGMDGFALARELRSQELAPPRLIAMTGYGDGDTRNKALLAGFDACLPKPLDLAELGRLLSGSCRAQAEAAPLPRPGQDGGLASISPS